MTGARRGESTEAPDKTPEQLAGELRDKARKAAVVALRAGLTEIDDRYGMEVASEVVGLIDIAETFDGLIDENQKSDDRDDGPYDLGLSVKL